MDDPFLVQIDAFIGKAKRRQDQVLQAIAQDALARVKELTPVKTGYLRANWTVIRSGDTQALVATTASEAERGQESLAVIVKLKAGDSFTLVNPVIYARRMEFGFVGQDSLGRNYDQKGIGMMQQTIAEMPLIAARAIARVSQQR